MGMMFSVFFREFLKMAEIAFFLGALGCTYVAENGEEDSKPLRLTFLDVGQGLAVLMEYEGRYAMYDMGPDSVGVVDSLARRGVDTLEWVLLGHNHRDHAGGFWELLDDGSSLRVHVRQLYVGPDTSGGFVRDSVLRFARNHGIPVDTVVRGTKLNLTSENRMEVLWPPEYMSLGGNGASVVVLCEYGAGTVLLTGDLDSLGESLLLELSPSLKADLMQVPHHGSSGSNSLLFLSRVSPTFAVVSVGKNNTFGHPTVAVLNKYKFVLRDSSLFYRTDRDGSAHFDIFFSMGVLND